MTDPVAYQTARDACNYIERVMLDALLEIRPLCLDPDEYRCILSDHPRMKLHAQYRSSTVAPFILDFALFVTLPGAVNIQFDIECDGHEFHHATPDQVKHDLRRNRHLANLGWNVHRVSGSEIVADADRCVRDISEAVDAEFAKLVRIGAEHSWKRLQDEAA